MVNLINCPSLTLKKHKLLKTPAGSKTKPVYKYVYNEKYGCPRRVISGEIDIDAYIQQAADDVDFKALGQMIVDSRDNVVSHFQMEGEVLDVTKLPRNIEEYQALYVKMQDEFNKLPVEMKALFGNDINQFRTCWMNGSIGSILDGYYKGIAQPAATTTEENPDAKE